MAGAGSSECGFMFQLATSRRLQLPIVRPLRVRRLAADSPSADIWHSAVEEALLMGCQRALGVVITIGGAKGTHLLSYMVHAMLSQ